MPFAQLGWGCKSAADTNSTRLTIQQLNQTPREIFALRNLTMLSVGWGPWRCAAWRLDITLAVAALVTRSQGRYE